MQTPFRSQSIILLYHRIASVERDPWSLCVTPQHFAEQLEILRKHRRTPLSRLRPGRWSMRGGLSVAVTFDDGYADNLHEALPVLRRYDTPATFFIATGYVDSPGEFWWDDLERIVYAQRPPAGVSSDDWHTSLHGRLQPLSHDVRRMILDQMLEECGQTFVARPSHRILTSQELTELASQDLIEIGAHTVTHPLLAAQTTSEQVAEFRRSKRWLEALLGRRVTSASYPYGGAQHYSPATVQAVHDAGFDRACTTHARFVRPSDRPLEWGRIQVPDVDGDEFEKFLFQTEGYKR